MSWRDNFTPEQLEARKKKQREYRKARREADREAHRAEAAAWRAANKDKIAAYNRKQWDRIKADPDLLERERARRRVENMAPERVEAKREAGRFYSRSLTEAARELGYTRYELETDDAARARDTEKMRRWRAENRERALEINRRASRAYRDRRGARAAIDTYAYKALRGALVAADAKSRYFPGFTGRQLKAHLMSLMPNGWTFADYGDKWEIDHIVPVSAFEYESPDDPEYKECWALSNLRPLCKFENRAKGNR